MVLVSIDAANGFVAEDLFCGGVMGAKIWRLSDMEEHNKGMKVISGEDSFCGERGWREARNGIGWVNVLSAMIERRCELDRKSWGLVQFLEIVVLFYALLNQSGGYGKTRWEDATQIYKCAEASFKATLREDSGRGNMASELIAGNSLNQSSLTAAWADLSSISNLRSNIVPSSHSKAASILGRWSAGELAFSKQVVARIHTSHTMSFLSQQMWLQSPGIRHNRRWCGATKPWRRVSRDGIGEYSLVAWKQDMLCFSGRWFERSLWGTEARKPVLGHDPAMNLSSLGRLAFSLAMTLFGGYVYSWISSPLGRTSLNQQSRTIPFTDHRTIQTIHTLISTQDFF
jgi:hypothetical protein